jgi:hypothetical protein
LYDPYVVRHQTNIVVVNVRVITLTLTSNLTLASNLTLNPTLTLTVGPTALVLDVGC